MLGSTVAMRTKSPFEQRRNFGEWKRGTDMENVETGLAADNSAKADARGAREDDNKRIENLGSEAVTEKLRHEKCFPESDSNESLPNHSHSTSAGVIEPFHPDLYEFMSPWGRPFGLGRGKGAEYYPATEEPKAPTSWQDFEDDFDTKDDWQDFADYEQQAVNAPEDLELLKALKDRAADPEKRYKSWRAYVDALADPEVNTEPLNRTIHILGLGSAGKYIAHSLAGLPFAPPVTLLMHRPLMMQHWHDEGAAIHVIKSGKIETQTNFHIESSAEFTRIDPKQRFPGFGARLEHTAEPPQYPIDALIVTTETDKTISALNSIKHRLRHTSTIFLINDGLGLSERINEQVFPDPYQRPTYVLGSMSHNLESTERHFTLIERSTGRLECSKLPQVFISRLANRSATLRRKDYSWTAGASHLVQTLARTPQLNTLTLGHKSFYESQLQKLAANAVIGPLSVVFDCTNDYLLYNYNASQTMKLLLKEISHIICALPEVQSLPDLRKTFNARKLEAGIVSKIAKSGKNVSAMLKSVRAGNRTNIEFCNGYLDWRAKELGVDAPRNQMLLYLVRGKSSAKSRELNNYIPFEDY